MPTREEIWEFVHEVCVERPELHFDGPEEWASHKIWREGRLFSVERLPAEGRPDLPHNSRITAFEAMWYGRGNKISGVKF